jgi:hypothetical protein
MFSQSRSFRREGILGTSGHVRFVVAYGIATVFTPERNRKLGYAQHMMRLLHWVLAEPAFRAAHPFPAIWGEPPAVPQHVGNGAWSTLFSDVGPSFYERCGLTNVPGGGWQVDKPVGTVWKVPQEPIFDSEDPEWTPLDLKGAEHLWQEDAKWMAEDVQERSHVEQGITFFAYLPTSGLAAQQVQRTLDPQTGALPFDICGVQHNILSANCVTYATWGLNLRGSGPRSLIVTRLRAPDATVFESLWRQLVRVSQAANIAEIEVWNLPSHLIEIAAHLGGLTRAREEHLPAFMMYSAHHGRPEWMFNEKYVIPGSRSFYIVDELTVSADSVGVER